MFRHKYGHDLKVDAQDVSLGGIRSGWPKTPADYPRGYGVANPPGFCLDSCDCMDDQRPQQSWETLKPWLEDVARSSAALASVETLAAQTRFVRRRGLVTRMCYLETDTSNLGNEAHARAALDLAGMVQRAIVDALKLIPLSELGPSAGVQFIVQAFLSDDTDYLPLRLDNTTLGGGPPPGWVHLNPATGELTVDAELFEDAQLQVKVRHAEGLVASCPYALVREWPAGMPKSWIRSTVSIMTRFNDQSQCTIEMGVRNALKELLMKVFDFSANAVRERPLGLWLRVMGRLLRMCRCAAVSNVALGSHHHFLIRDQPGRA
eukprot:NODE_7189_length_1600_cov_9.175832.p1 GENE.NODE_7189_length_1600_cov_9.175832~~NODE_7189_length_1600_cov_9.175832.p1  ORF type:complete len:320 (-),score=70.91 NODE_7189_length_1600_cov_9.175832:83-1042(-)